MTSKLPKNRCSIYLLKKEFHNKFLRNGHGMTETSKNSNIWTESKFSIKPKWVNNFFVGKELDLKTSSVAAIYKTSINIEGEEVYFVACFGTGYHKLNPDAYEKNFGIKTALSMGDINQIRSINKKDISGSP